MEVVTWLTWEDWGKFPLSGSRVYLGHETCENRLPTLEKASECARDILAGGKQLTLVTPFLTPKGLGRTLRLIDELERLGEGLEVVCHDWGLIEVLAGRSSLVPILGRLLVRQDTDPRLAQALDPVVQANLSREVTHVDGTIARLRYRSPPDKLVRHWRSCSLDEPDLLQFLKLLGVGRFEVSNVLQGLHLDPLQDWRVTLHLPEVLVAVARRCAFLGGAADCLQNSGVGCGSSQLEVWRHPSLPVDLYRRDNAVYYANPNPPEDLAALSIDRLVNRRPLPPMVYL